MSNKCVICGSPSTKKGIIVTGYTLSLMTLNRRYNVEHLPICDSTKCRKIRIQKNKDKLNEKLSDEFWENL